MLPLDVLFAAVPVAEDAPDERVAEPEPEAEPDAVAAAAKMSVEAYVLQLLVAAEVGV